MPPQCLDLVAQVLVLVLVIGPLLVMVMVVVVLLGIVHPLLVLVLMHPRLRNPSPSNPSPNHCLSHCLSHSLLEELDLGLELDWFPSQPPPLLLILAHQL